MAIVRGTRVADHRVRAGARSWRLIVVLVGGAALLWVTVMATLAQVVAQIDPPLALRAWPIAVSAQAYTAAAALTPDITPAAAVTIRAEATRALQGEPVNVVAARVAGMADGLLHNDKGSRRLLAYAQELSRRDLETQIVLIELAVADQNIPAALTHYDLALRTHYESDPLVMPTLVSASRNPQIAKPIGTMLGQRPPWRMRFVYSLLTAQPWAQTFLSLMISARLDSRDPLERDFLTRAAKGLADGGRIDEAARLYAHATGTPVHTGVRNGDFAAEDRIAPFDWDIADDPGLGGLKGSIDGAHFPAALSLIADPGRSGAVAKQLLLLVPGRYELRFTAGNVDGRDRSGVSLSCSASQAILADLRLPVTSVARAVTTMIIVPAGCTSQWLSIRAGTDIDASRGDTSSPWISGIGINR